MKTNISDKDVQKIREQLKKLEKKQRDPKSLERAIKAETEGMGFIEGERRANQLREQWQIATEQTTGMMSGFLTGLFGQDLGKLLSKRYAKADEDQIKQAQEYFDKFKKSEEKKDKVTAKKTERTTREFTGLKKTVVDIQKNVNLIRKSLTGKSTPEVKPGFFFDTRMAGGGRFKETATNKIVSKDVALKRTEDLSKAIAADEDPMIKISETIDSIYKSLGKETKNKTVHEKLDDIYMDMDSGGGFNPLDLLGGGGGGGRNRRGRRGGRRGGGRGTRGGRMRGGIGVAGLLGGAALGYLGYSAIDSMRDENLESYDPEMLKQEAISAREAGDTGATSAIQDQITAQKRDLKIQAGATAAGVGGAVAGAVAVKKAAQTTVVKNVKSKAWDLFVNFVKKRAPKLFAKIGARLAMAGGLATIPLLGWVSAAITVVGSVWLAYDLYTLWKEFSALSDAEKELYSDQAQKAATTMAPQPATVSPTASTVTQPATAAPVSTPNVAATETPPQQSFASIAAGSVQSAVSSVKSFLGMEGAAAQDLKKYIRTKDSSVNVDGLNEQLKTRLAGLAKEYYEKTGSKIQINSGYRSPEEQAALFAKFGAPRAAPPGRSRHESGLAFDMNSPDANRAIELGLMQKYGFTRPVRGETWHIEPVETAKRGGTPDNPFKPGGPIVASNDGKAVDPKTGKAPTGGMMNQSVAQAESGSVAGSAPAPTTAPTAPAPMMASAAPSVEPVQSTVGPAVQQQSELLASNQMAMQAAPAPVVNNVVNQAPAPAAPQAKAPMTKAEARPADSSFMRALAKDFAHPSAFTTVSLT